MEIDHCGLQGTVPEILLDEAQVDAGFEQMRGVAVPERVNRDPLAEAELPYNTFHRAVNAGRSTPSTPRGPRRGSRSAAATDRTRSSSESPGSGTVSRRPRAPRGHAGGRVDRLNGGPGGPRLRPRCSAPAPPTPTPAPAPPALPRLCA